jgi:hypothetical protein
MAVEQRANIKFCFKLGKTAGEAYEMMKSVYGSDCLSRSNIFRWYAVFCEGSEGIEDAPCASKPRTSYLYAKKQNINKQVYILHLKNAQYWQCNWHIIENNINTRLYKEASQHNHMLHNKLNSLAKHLEDKGSITNKQTFYPRLQTMTNIQFSNKEITLLNLGGKYNMSIPPRQCIK